MWEVSLNVEVEAWFLDICRQDPATADLIEHAIDLLADQGPALGRPLVDRLRGSRFHNMKELRPPSSGATEIRLIFAFDPLPGSNHRRRRGQVRTVERVVPEGYPARR